MGRARIVKIIIGSLCSLVVIVGVNMLLTTMGMPSKGTIDASMANSIATSATPSTSTKLAHASNNFVSFDFPAFMRAEPMTEPVAPELAHMSYTYRDLSSWKLTISIRTLNSPGLKYDASYMFRKSHPEQYTGSQKAIGGLEFTSMVDSKASGFGEVAYTTYSTKVAEISLVGDSANGTQKLSDAFNDILKSWHWNE